ncbi:hypothetical protein [Achromobacter spanius]|uniref:RNA polymerase sigma-70 region 4 domain-containing protein n=1 Tax=Achromobacter spanius TaxID=217203 RepID=A0AAW3I8H0_9BURK|nr:hypothetical protein [Achromobacter spanius]KNE28200.1 hypothetical protein AFM18_08540 [Achromobacter spanius]
MSNPNQGAATRARNEEIERRLTAGESGPALAREFGVTQPRVHQIARAVREARGVLKPRTGPAQVKATAATRIQDPRPAPAVYFGPVTVVAGTQVAPRPFAMSPSMAYAAARARQEQRPVPSLAGSRERAV